VVTRLQVVAESREITLESGSDEEVPAAQLDLDLVSRVLQNLVSNALKFTPRNGQVIVGAAPAAAEVLETRLPGRGDGVLFTVRDNGPGIPDDERERIFEKFGVVESRKAGIKVSTGLGLAFCKQAVRAHRGAIWVENAPEGGSLFSVLLPLSAG
jgi:signal transduction histidine kinase